MPPTRPPVQPSALQTAERAAAEGSLLQRNMETIVQALKSGQGEEVKQIRAMFRGDKVLMDRFLAVCFASLRGNGAIVGNCDPLTVVQAIRDAAALGLEPTGLTGEAAIVPRGRQAVLQPMWRGYLKRIRNSGKVQDVDCQLVYDNDEFSVQLGTDPSIHHVPLLFTTEDDEASGRGGYRGAYAWALMPSGKMMIEWMPTADINTIRDRYSDSYKNENSRANSPWSTSWGQMARKTVIRRLAGRLPQEAVDLLLRVDEQADALERAAFVANPEVSKVQRMAIAAASGAGQPESGSDRREDPEGQAAEQPATAPETSVCGAVSPYAGGAPCVREKGHPGNHATQDRESWN